MSLVAKLLPAERRARLQVSSKKRLFEQVGLLFENHHDDRAQLVFDSLFAREKLGSTGLGQGVAIPHGRIKGLKEALGAFIRVRPAGAVRRARRQPGDPGVRAAGAREGDREAPADPLRARADVQRQGAARGCWRAPTPRRLHQLVTAWQPDAAGQRRAAA